MNLSIGVVSADLVNWSEKEETFDMRRGGGGGAEGGGGEKEVEEDCSRRRCRVRKIRSYELDRRDAIIWATKGSRVFVSAPSRAPSLLLLLLLLLLFLLLCS